mgnify:CR=1 FL=1
MARPKMKPGSQKAPVTLTLTPEVLRLAKALCGIIIPFTKWNFAMEQIGKH